MMSNAANFIKKIKDLTDKGLLNWRASSNMNCFYSSIDSQLFIICKYYPSNSNTYSAMLTLLDEDGIINEKFQYYWAEGTPEFDSLVKICDNLSQQFKTEAVH